MATTTTPTGGVNQPDSAADDDIHHCLVCGTEFPDMDSVQYHIDEEHVKKKNKA